MSLKTAAVVSFLALNALASTASATVVDATGTGWCDSRNYCNNTNTQQPNNLDISSVINNWQAYTLGNYGTISSAVLSIHEASNYGSFHSFGPGDINFYIASDFSFGGLKNGPSIGTILNGSVNSVGTYVNISLNAYGIEQLNKLQGKSFVIGGSNNGASVDAFGYTSGWPAPYLTLTTVARNEVPEPGSIALLALGALGLAALRRKNAA